MDSIEKNALNPTKPEEKTGSLELVTASDVSFREKTKPKDPYRLDVVIVGDPLVGKTSLIHSYINQISVVCGNWHLLLPSVLDVKEKKVKFEGQIYTLIVSYNNLLKLSPF